MNLIHILSVILLFWIVIGTPISSFSSDKKALDYYSNPEAIVHEVSSRGAGVVVSELYSDLNIWYEVLRKIGSGNKLWLKVAISLQPGSDAGIGEMLDLAIGEGLEHDPENVLGIAPKAFRLKTICGGPDVDDARYDSYELSIKAINLRIEKVASIKDPALKNICKDCIQYLEASKKAIARFYGVEDK